MATKKQTTVNQETKTEVPAVVVDGKTPNPRKIVWPHDTYGITSMFRKEGVRAIGRIRGDKAKYETFKATMRALLEHAEQRFENDVAYSKARAAARKVKQDAEYARSLADQEAEVARLERLLASAQAQVAAKKAMPGEEDA